MLFTNSIKSAKQAFTKGFEGLRGIDFLLIALIFTAVMVVIAIAVTYVIATQTRLSSYKTPIPLTQTEYQHNEIIKGYYKGEKLYNGRVDIVRQISCNDGYIDTLVDLKTAKKYTASILPARKIDGNYARNIASVPDAAKIGSSCIIAFSHSACIPYLFGCFNVEYSYVSLPFTVTEDKPQKEPAANPNDTERPANTIPDEKEGLSPPPVNDGPVSVTPAPVSPPQSGVTYIPQQVDEPVPPKTPLFTTLEAVNGTLKSVLSPVTNTLRDLLGSN